jgi:hypothetical protein
MYDNYSSSPHRVGLLVTCRIATWMVTLAERPDSDVTAPFSSAHISEGDGSIALAPKSHRTVITVEQDHEVGPWCKAGRGEPE